MIDVGVAYFDNSKAQNLGGGWYSLNGERSRMFASASGDLDPQVLWITNLGYNEYSDYSFSGTSHIRNENFFRMSLKSVGQELGVYDSTKIPDAVEVLSGVASRTINLAGRSMPGLRFGGFSLPESIYTALGLTDQKTDPSAAYQSEFQAAFQEYSVVTANRSYFGETDLVRFVPNRVMHVEQVLSYFEPTGEIRLIQGEMSVDEFLSLEHPAIASAVIDNSSAEMPELLAYGAQYQSSGVMRTFVAQPEVYFMTLSGSRFKLKDALVFSSSAKPPQLPESLTENALIRNSYSAGLVADNFLSALMSKRRTQGKRIRNSVFFPSRAVFMRSIDRMLSYEMARQLADAGLRVNAYGFGVVSVKLSASEFADALMVGADLGFSILATPSERFERG